MWHGYDQTCMGWNPRKQDDLAQELRLIVEEKLKLWGLAGPHDGTRRLQPYVESDKDGVRIRRVTDLTDTQRQELTDAADRAFDLVMGANPKCN